MNAILFTIVLFAFFCMVGYGVLCLCRPRLENLPTALISPAVGIALTILPVFVLNRLGLPVQQFALTLFLALSGLSLFFIVIRKSAFPFNEMRFILPILIAALALTAWPMILYGFDWVSFANDDMANYALGAERFLHHGFFAEPNFDSSFAGRDYADIYWALHVAAGIRAGSELMLAAIWAVSGINAHFIFMPVMLALHLSLICATGAMASKVVGAPRAAFVSMALMAASPMSTLGVLYQLIAQVGGLALLAVAVVLTYRPVPGERLVGIAVSTMPAVFVLSALIVWYPELLPFFGLGWMVYVATTWIADRIGALRVVYLAAVVAFLIVVVLNSYVFEALRFLLEQTQVGVATSQQAGTLFPYFLVPSGLAASIGLIPIGGNVPDPWLSLLIFVSAVILLWLAIRVTPSRLKFADPIAGVFAAMAATGVVLFFLSSGFGLFKLIMYIQPFLMALLATYFAEWKYTFRLIKGRYVVSVASAVALGLPIAICQQGYVTRSTGELFGGLSEIPQASSKYISRQFSDFVTTLQQDKKIGYYSDTTNIVLSKFQAFYSSGITLEFPSRYFFKNISDIIISNKFRNVDKYKTFISVYNKTRDENLAVQHIRDGELINEFIVPRNISSILEKYSMITTSERQTIFDRKRPASAQYFSLDQKPTDKLLFVDSTLGNNYYLGQSGKISYYQLENDPMFPGQIFSALGRHLLFMAINSEADDRVRMELTGTVLKGYASALPDAKVQGIPIGFVGRGSGRVFSRPALPTAIDGVNYLSVDMGRIPIQPATRRQGLMNLYGRDISPDPRYISAFGRDISLITNADFLALVPPTALKAFPADLANTALEYSGIYEDGWISERSFFTLSAQPATKFITMRGTLPQLADPGFSTTVKVALDGQPIGEVPIALGAFVLKIPVGDITGKHRVDFDFTRFQTLPGSDGRITGGKIDFIGFTEE